MGTAENNGEQPKRGGMTGAELNARLKQLGKLPASTRRPDTSRGHKWPSYSSSGQAERGPHHGR